MSLTTQPRGEFSADQTGPRKVKILGVQYKFSVMIIADPNPMLAEYICIDNKTPAYVAMRFKNGWLFCYHFLSDVFMIKLLRSWHLLFSIDANNIKDVPIVNPWVLVVLAPSTPNQV
jgi:hypothetical protein